MDKNLETLMKQSLEMSGSVFKQMEQLIGSFNLSVPAAVGAVPGTDLLNGVVQLNQLTLSTLELLRNWEKVFDSFKLFIGSFPGWSVAKDDRQRELEKKITALNKKLDEQGSLIEELQAKLKIESEQHPDSADPVGILSDFFARQNEQFQKLLKRDIP